MYGQCGLFSSAANRACLRYASPIALVTAREPATRWIPPVGTALSNLRRFLREVPLAAALWWWDGVVRGEFGLGWATGWYRMVLELC